MSPPIGLRAEAMAFVASPGPGLIDEVAAELKRTLDIFKVPPTEQDQVLGAFAAHKDEVTRGYREAAGAG